MENLYPSNLCTVSTSSPLHPTFNTLVEEVLLDGVDENKSVTKVLVMDIGSQDFAYMLKIV